VKVYQSDYAYNDQATKILHNVAVSAANTYTDKTAWYDAKEYVSTDCAITWDNDDVVLIGYSEPFNKVTWNVYVAGTENDVVATQACFYYDGTAFVGVSNFSDGTLSGGKTLKQAGTMSWTIEPDWLPCTINGTEAYWIMLNASATLTAGVQILEVYVTVDQATTENPNFVDLSEAYDSDATTYELLNLGTEDYLYVGYGTKFNKITFNVGTVNAVASTLTGAYWNGSAWTSVTITDGTKSGTTTLAQNGDVTFTIPDDWEANTVNSIETYWIRLDVSVALTPLMSINEITVTRQNNVTVMIPVLTAGDWTTVMTDLATPKTIPDETTIKSIGLYVNSDEGANVFHVRKLWLADTAVDSVEETAFRMPGGKRINGLQAYAGNVDDPILNPWIFTTDSLYEMQTQNDDQIVEIPLEELGALSSPENGLGHCVNGTYLYFNLGEKIERYFNRTLDDIGPDRDEGLPAPGGGVASRQGIPKSLASYPGRVYAGIDAGVSGRSSVLGLDGTAWHEIYTFNQFPVPMLTDYG
jgi:hypothetical protein